MIPSNRLKLGEYILCPLNQQLEYADNAIPLEPKVYEVLCYLLAHHQRFVSLEELHQNVWQGRVVSDTAVRRTISKLRAALNDQGEMPQYIQSAAKRGYRWLVLPEPTDTAFSGPAAIVATASAALDQTPPQMQALLPSDADPADKPKSALSLLARRYSAKVYFITVTAVGIFITLLALFYLQQTPRWKLQSALPLIAGEKLSMAISPDKRFLVFSSNAVNHYGQELYWYNLQTEELKQLTTGDNQIMYVAFAADGKHLFYHNFANGVYQLIQRPINELGQFTAEGKVLLDNYVTMFKIWAHPDNNALLLTLGDAKQSNIQRLDLATGTLTPVTSSMTAGVNDTIFAVDPNTQWLAFQRFPGQGSSLIIQSLHNGRILQQFIHKFRIFDLHWLSEHELLIVDEEAIKRFNVQTEESIILQQNYQTGNSLTRGLTRTVVPLDNTHWLQFLHEGDVGRMIHQQGAVGALNGRSYIHTEPQTRAVFFNNQPDTFILLNIEEQTRSLVLREADGKHKTLFEIQNSNISLQQQHPDGSSLLMLLDGKPTLFDLKQHQLIPLNVVGNHWLSARFSVDGKNIVMTSRQNGEYQSWLYQTETGLSQLLFQGYQLVLPYQADSYIAVHPDSRFLLLKGQQITELAVRYNPPYPGSVHVRGSALFWAETDLKNTKLFRFNLDTAALDTWQQDRRQMLQTFDISPDGAKWLLRHTGQFDTKVYNISASLP